MTIRSSLSSLYPSTIAVYILALNSGHYYIGSTKSLARRLRDHRSYLEGGKHQNFRLQRWYETWDSIRIAYTAYNTVEEALEEEQRLIDRHYDDPYCCNLATDSRSIWGNGRGCPPEIAERISVSNRGKIFTDEFREKCRQRMLGSKPSELTRQRTSNSMKGRTLTEEHRANLSIALKGKTIGRRHTEIQKQRRAETWEKLGGFKHRESSRKLIADANKKPVIIDGVRYASIMDAAEALDMNRATISYRVRSDSSKFAGYFYE